MSTELAASPAATSTALCMFANAELFELVQRQAKLISSSDLIPKQFQGNVANCAIALEMASRLGASPFAVIQNLDVIHGRPSWRSVFLMGMINACGRFTPLQFRVEVTGKQKTVELEIDRWDGPQGARKKTTVKKPYTYTPTTCIAWAKYKATGEVVEGPPVSYDMALDEGWVAKDGSKWLTELRELMLRYRAASFFAKVHASDLTLGMQTAEESFDAAPSMRNVTPEADGGKSVQDKNPWAKEEFTETKPSTTTEPVAAEVVSEPAPSETAAAEPARPDKQAMVADIREACVERNVSTPEATRRYRAYGVIPVGKKFQDLNDDELFAVWKVRGIALDQQPEAAASVEGGDK